MKTSFIKILIFGLFLNLSCEKKNYSSRCYSAKILKISCGGTVLQLLNVENIGVDWRNSENNADYKNCVLAGIISPQTKSLGDTVYISFNKVDFFLKGNFCDIGGLPSTKIEVKDFYTKSCLN